MRKIIIEVSIDWPDYDDVDDMLVIEDAIEAKVDGVYWQVLNKPEVSGGSEQSGFEEGYAKGYNDATREACAEIHKNYIPNDR